MLYEFLLNIISQNNNYDIYDMYGCW